MNEELLYAIAKLTRAVNGVSASLFILIAILIFKDTNSNAAIHSLQNDVRNVGAAISDLSRNLCVALRLNRGGKDDG